MNAMKPIQSSNDFVIKFANVNGSGSASANELFARAIMRMGVPVAPRNIFPSNIQGMPTWYEMRVSAAGWLGRRGGCDLMVAMNPQTWDRDVAEIEPGGYLFYDSTRAQPRSRFREDITVLGIPLTEICNREYSDPRQRQLFKNIMYVGALTALLGMDFSVVEKLIADQYRGKDKLIGANVNALKLGYDHARANLPCPIGLRVERADGVGDKIFINGNDACGLGAVYGGATVAAWYPITPSTSVIEAFSSYCRKYRTDPDNGMARYAIVQAEDELASIGMVIGAAWNGARAFTATSGPGISLMQEFFGLAYFAEVPVVVFNVQRGGPSTGMPTRTQQSDLISCAYASHGDTKHVLLFPEDPYECFTLGAQAFDLADRLQTPVFVLLDLDIGMNDRLCHPFDWDDSRRYDRGKVMRPRCWMPARTSAATSMSMATAFPGAPFPAPTRPRVPSSAAAPRAMPTPSTARPARTMSTTWSACATSWRRPRSWCRRPCCSRHRSPPVSARSITARPVRPWPRPPPCSKHRASMSIPCACAASRLPTR
jgi:2-oxoglutarate ferredoxin oxidoreductase subunit alpha